MKRWIILIQLMTMLIIVTATDPAAAAQVLPGYQNWQGQDSIRIVNDVQYSWDIKFNQLLPDEFGQLSSHIFVSDAENNVLATNLNLSERGDILSITPQASNLYQPGREYRLYIKTGLMNREGNKNLSRGIVMPFKVQSTGHIVRLDTRTDYLLSSRLTSFTLLASPSVYYAKIDGVSMNYSGNNTFKLTKPGLAAGKTVSIQVYDSQNHLLESLAYTLP